MNFKTTLVLALVLVVALGILYLAGTGEQPPSTPPTAPTTLLEDRPLIAEDFGEVLEVVCKRRDGQEWRFERQADEDDLGRAQWNMSAPLEVKATAWQIDGIVRKLKQLKYQIKYAPGSAGAVTAAQAGLEGAPSAVTLEAQSGATVTVEIGKDLSDRESYVRLAGAEDIYVVSPNLHNLLRKKAIEYRDQQLADFTAEHVKGVEIVDRPEEGEPVIYTLVRSDAGWTFETPSKASAVKDKIDAVVQSLSALRVTEWVEAEAADPSVFGLGEEGVTIRATIEEPVEKEEEADQDEEQAEESQQEETQEESPEPESPNEAEPEPIIREFVVHLSRRSPLGQDTKVYVCRGDDRAVGTITKTVADRLMPNLSEWQDLRLTTAAVTSADRIELTTPQGGATFEKEQGKWVDAGGGEVVDGEAVSSLLSQLKNLKARSFVPLEGESTASFGLDEPQAVIRLNVPGLPEAESFAVGGYTDAKTRRLVHVRHKQADSVAKVRVADVSELIRPPAEYRDRTIFDLKPDEIEQVTISRPDDLIDGVFAFTLARVEGDLRMIAPAPAKTSAEQVKKLAAALGKLKARRVVPATDPAQYGLDPPAITCRITHQPPEITKYIEVPVKPEQEEGAAAEAAEGAQDRLDRSSEEPIGNEAVEEAPATRPADKPKTKLKTEKYKPPAEVYELSISEHDQKVYAKRGDRPTIYEVARSLLKQLQAEYHDPVIFDFQESQAVSVTAPDAEGSPVELRKVDDQWQSTAEPDLPIDPKKVADLLLRIKDLKTERFIAYGAADLAAYGLDQPWRSLVLELEDQTEVGLVVSPGRCEKDADKRHYAAVRGGADIFLLPDDAVERFVIDLAEFEAP